MTTQNALTTSELGEDSSMEFPDEIHPYEAYPDGSDSFPYMECEDCKRLVLMKSDGEGHYEGSCKHCGTTYTL